MPDIDSLSREARRLLDALPDDGAPIGNIGLRRSLGWTDQHYKAVREELIAAGCAVAKRGGTGGSVQRLELSEDAGVPATSPEVNSERQLYEPFQSALAAEWASLEPYEQYLATVTALQGRRATGRLSRPDLTFVGYLPHRVLPWGRLDVVTFEIKRGERDQADVSAVYQTLAYKRFSHRAYLAVADRFHRPGQEVRSLAPIEAACREVDVGLIVFSDPRDVETWDVRYEPPEHEPHNTSVDEFLAEQLPEHIDTIRGWFFNDAD